MNNTWILTHSGIKFDVMNPDPDLIRIEDIAYSLARLARFNGHIPNCSVARHSIHVSLLVPADDAMWGLLHDAAEAYIGDIPAPLKRCLPKFQEIEGRITRAVAERFDMDMPIPETVHEADRQACVYEARCGWDDNHITDDWGIDDEQSLIGMPINLPKSAQWSQIQFAALLEEYQRGCFYPDLRPEHCHQSTS